MFFHPHENKEHAQKRHCAESHIGPGFRQRRRPVGQKTVNKIAVIGYRPQQGNLLAVCRPGILQKAQDDRQENKGGQQCPDQPVPDESNPVQDHCAEMTQSMQPDRAPDRVQRRHDDHHVEEIEIAHRCDKDHQNKQPGLLFAEIPLASDQQEREEDKRIQEIMMAHSRHGESVENIDQRARQHCDPVLSAHIKVVGAESDARQPEAHQEHQIMIMEQIFFRHKNSRQTERIPDHIVSQRSEQVSAIAHAQRKGRKLQRARLPQIPQHLFSPSGKKHKPVIMLIDTVCLPYKPPFLQKKPHKNSRRHHAEQQCI